MSEATAPAKLKPGLNPDFGARFREGRKAARASLEAVGAAAEVSLQSIAHFEKGISRLEMETFVLACGFLRLDVRWVLRGEGKMFDGPPPASPKPRPARRTS